MDKRKLRTSKLGKKTIVRNRYGTNYNKVSDLVNTTEPIETLDEMREIVDSFNKTYDIKFLLEGIEGSILSWLKKNELPISDERTETSWKSLDHILEKRHGDHKGAKEAADCLFKISVLNSFLTNENKTTKQYEEAICHALHLVTTSNRFLYAIVESDINLGKTKLNGSFVNKPKLTNEQAEECRDYYHSLPDAQKGMKRDKTALFALEQFGVEIKSDTLRKTYHI